MDGRTSAQIVADVVAALQASASITGTVPSAKIVHSRVPPIGDGVLPYIIVFAHRETEDWIGYHQYPIMRVLTEVAVQLYVTAATDAALETALDLLDTVKQVLYTATVFQTDAEKVDTCDTLRDLAGDGQRRTAVGQLLFRVRHQRAY